jgi:hypothetical protein
MTMMMAITEPILLERDLPGLLKRLLVKLTSVMAEMKRKKLLNKSKMKRLNRLLQLRNNKNGQRNRPHLKLQKSLHLVRSLNLLM